MSAKLRRARVARRREAALPERITEGAIVVAHRARKQPHRRVDDRQRGGFATGEHEVAQGELLGREMLGDALVHVLIVSAQDRELVARGEAYRIGLREATAARTHQ